MTGLRTTTSACLTAVVPLKPSAERKHTVTIKTTLFNSPYSSTMPDELSERTVILLLIVVQFWGAVMPSIPASWIAFLRTTEMPALV